MWKPDGPVGFESRKVKALLPRYARGKVLEIGCGSEKAYPSYIGYDQHPGAANIVGDAKRLWLFADGVFDTVFSSHCLEDMEDMVAVLNEWARVLKDGGCMILYLPSANYYPKIGEAGANPNHKHDIYPADIPVLFGQTRYDWEVLELQERIGGNEYSIYTVIRKVGTGSGNVVALQKPAKTACVWRTGGFWDIMMAATVLPGLKREGYHVCFMTTDSGESILKNNPYVDEVLTIDIKGLKADDIYPIWEAQRTLFDKWINLQNSMENALLSFPATVEYRWPENIRRSLFNANYSEFVFALAELPFDKPQVFFPTQEETEKAWRIAGQDTFNIMFVVAGSTLHKKTPHQDTVIGAILHAIPEARFFLVGDDKSAFLEDNWRDEPRVECLCGKLPLRDTLALAYEMDCVIGPETGVMNCICYEEIPKVIYLSHSSPENLTKHWVATHVLTPQMIECYPCHRLHYKPETCNVDPKTGAALCVDSIGPEEYISAIIDAYSGRNLPAMQAHKG